jgi:hypothetical protein
MRRPSLYPAGASITDNGGPMVAPGTYTAQLMSVIGNDVTPLTDPQSFSITPLFNTKLTATDREELATFHRQVSELQRTVGATGRVVGETQERLDHLRAALFNTIDATPEQLAKLNAMESQLRKIRVDLYGDRTISRRSEPVAPSLSQRINRAAWSTDTTQGPTGTHREILRLVREKFPPLLEVLRNLIDQDLVAFEKSLEAMGAPWTPGRIPVWRAE